MERIRYLGQQPLTERTKSLKPILDLLLQWSVDHMDDIMRDRKKATPIND